MYGQWSFLIAPAKPNFVLYDVLSILFEPSIVVILRNKTSIEVSGFNYSHILSKLQLVSFNKLQINSNRCFKISSILISCLIIWIINTNLLLRWFLCNNKKTNSIELISIYQCSKSSNRFVNGAITIHVCEKLYSQDWLNQLISKL